MPNPGSSEVGQRRFWNALSDSPGVISIGAWGGHQEGDALWASGDGAGWSLVYTGTQLNEGILPFPPEFKLCRFWKFTHDASGPGGSFVDWNGTNEWILKPYSTDMSVQGPDYWVRGLDWDTANLFYESSHFAIPTSIHYRAFVKATDIHGGYFDPYATGWGAGGLLYGYLNDVYFGNNEMGGNKPNVGVGPKHEAIGDLSKSYMGFWGNFGLSSGVATSAFSNHAEFVFDLCDRPEAMASAAGLSLENQSEGWGTDTAPISTDPSGHRIFTLSTSPARGTLNVYTPKGLQLMKGIDWDNDPCDTTGRVYRLMYDPKDICGGIYRVVVTYLVMAPTLRQAKRTTRITDTSTGHDRINAQGDIRGL